MSIHRQSTSRPSFDLLIDVDNTNGRRSGLESALRQAIRDGRLRQGDALPSTRSLASDLGVARATVVAAYEQLAAEGYVVARRGSATTVVYSPGQNAQNEMSRDATIDDATALVRAVTFHPGRPDLSGFPRREWRAAQRAVLNDVPDAELDYPDPDGCPSLRRSLASYLARTRATQSSSTDVVITAGFLAGLGIMADHFRRSGHGRVVVEDPNFYLYRMLLEYLELDVIPVSVDADGISTEVLEHIGVPVDAVLVCPARQYPMGMTMSAGRRTELVEWARERDAWIIEDDYDGEFRYDGRPVGALQGLAPDRVIHAGTASKSMAPGLRLGWLTLPETLHRSVSPDVTTRGSVSVLDQLTLSQMIDSGAYDRQIRTMRSRYRRRRDRVVESLGSIDGLTLSRAEAGLSICARFIGRCQDVDDRVVEASCFADGFGVVALSRHYANHEDAVPGAVIGFAAPPEHEFAMALDGLATSLTRALDAAV